MAASVTDESWPPQSARHALLGSPSGRKKYADIQAGTSTSPIKGLPGTPSLFDKMRLIKNDRDHSSGLEEDAVDDDEDDEEILQLKLAAIEARLKLKKLQSRTKRKDEALSSRPTSASGSSQIQVALSPAKRPLVAIEQKSPSRVLLGIDKGATGADISLRRAKSTHSSPVREERRQFLCGSSRQTFKPTGTQNTQKAKSNPAIKIQSFSERMAEVRGNERRQEEKRVDASKSRSRKFDLDFAEIGQLKAAAEKQESHVEGLSEVTGHINYKVTGGNIVEPTQQHGLRKAKTLPDLRDVAYEQKGDANLFEGFSGLHLSSRILPHSFLKRTLPLDRFTTYCIKDLLKNIISPTYEIPDEVGDFVVFGVIASKSSPLNQKNKTDDQIKTSNEWEKKWDDGLQNRKKFMVMTLTDLKWSVDLYLFDTALPRYHRLTPGTVIAILNPSIMPPKQSKADSGAFSLALHDGDDTVLEIGISKHLGFCNVTKKDGKQCGQWVDGTKTEICEWHLNAQIAKTQAKRMGVNAGANGFDSNGSRNRFDGRTKGRGEHGARGFDSSTGSQYYISSSNPGVRATPIYNPEVSTARMLDMDDDPFVAEGQFQRDKEALLRKRIVSQEKERDIAKKLANFGSGSGAGAEYMHRKTEALVSPKSTGAKLGQQRGQSSATALSRYTAVHPGKDMAQTFRPEIGKKRAAEDVRLSPLKKKKTRFLTDMGIKEAGRESIRASASDSRPQNDYDDNDDDELEII